MRARTVSARWTDQGLPCVAARFSPIACTGFAGLFRGRPTLRLHVHLISDSTGETVTTVARAAVSQFEDVVPVEHVWFFVRTRQQLEKVLAIVEVLPGLVIFTLASPELRHLLQERCHAARACPACRCSTAS